MTDMNDNKNNPRIVYADIIDRPHHQSANRNHMSLYDRAAQFAPFAALVGYDEMVREEARLTDQEQQLSEDERGVLDRKLRLIADVIEEDQRPEITVVYFEPDALKQGGSYTSYTGEGKKIDPIEGVVVYFAENGRLDGKTVPLGRIREIHGELVDYMNEE